MSSTTTTRKTRQPRQLRQRIDGDARAKLVSLQAAELVRKDATHFLRRKAFDNWLLAVEQATLPMGPELLPKTRKNIAAWNALTPTQQADRKVKAIEKARAEIAEAKAKRQTKKQTSVETDASA